MTKLSSSELAVAGRARGEGLIAQVEVTLVGCFNMVEVPLITPLRLSDTPTKLPCCPMPTLESRLWTYSYTADRSAARAGGRASGLPCRPQSRLSGLPERVEARGAGDVILLQLLEVRRAPLVLERKPLLRSQGRGSLVISQLEARSRSSISQVAPVHGFRQVQ